MSDRPNTITIDSYRFNELVLWHDRGRLLLAHLEWPARDYCEQCPHCGNHGPSAFRVDNYDPVWRDGDVLCTNPKCGKKVRNYDAG